MFRPRRGRSIYARFEKYENLAPDEYVDPDEAILILFCKRRKVGNWIKNDGAWWLAGSGKNKLFDKDGKKVDILGQIVVVKQDPYDELECVVHELIEFMLILNGVPQSDAHRYAQEVEKFLRGIINLDMLRGDEEK